MSDTSKTSRSPFAGSTGPLHTRLNAEAGLPGVLDVHAEESHAAPLSAAQESARREVLAQLEAHPTIKRAFVNRFEADGTMVITLGIRDVGTGELKIPAERFNQDSLEDYGALITIIGEASSRGLQ